MKRGNLDFIPETWLCPSTAHLGVLEQVVTVDDLKHLESPRCSIFLHISKEYSLVQVNARMLLFGQDFRV